MVTFQCDECHKPIDPQKDQYFDLPNLMIAWREKVGRVSNLHFCCKDHFISWVKKSSEPSSIIQTINPQGPAL